MITAQQAREQTLLIDTDKILKQIEDLINNASKNGHRSTNSYFIQSDNLAEVKQKLEECGFNVETVSPHYLCIRWH